VASFHFRATPKRLGKGSRLNHRPQFQLLLPCSLRQFSAQVQATRQSKALVEHAADPDIRSYSSISRCLFTFTQPLPLASVFSCYDATELAIIGADSVGSALWRQALMSDARLWNYKPHGYPWVMRILACVLVFLIDTTQSCSFIGGCIYLGLMHYRIDQSIHIICTKMMPTGLLMVSLRVLTALLAIVIDTKLFSLLKVF